MFIGHYGLALAAKRAAPRTSLGALVLGAQFLDLVWPLLLLTGTERVAIAPGLMAANQLDFVSYPWSHSLLSAALWGGVVGGVWWLWTRDRTGALVVGALIPSHWLLDLPMHRPDLPLWPGGPLVGLGLWNSLPATLVIEIALLSAGIWMYLRTSRARDRAGSVGLWVLVLLLVAFWLAGTFGPPPPSERALAIGALAMWLFVPWAWWVDRHREVGSMVGSGTEGLGN